jgi:hypothetical protein
MAGKIEIDGPSVRGVPSSLASGGVGSVRKLHTPKSAEGTRVSDNQMVIRFPAQS